LKLIAISKLSKDYIFWIRTHPNKEWYIYHTKYCTQLQGPINYNQKWYPCHKRNGYNYKYTPWTIKNDILTTKGLHIIMTGLKYYKVKTIRQQNIHVDYKD